MYIIAREADKINKLIERTDYLEWLKKWREKQILKRELAPLKKVCDNYPKYLLTLDEIFGSTDYNGIKKKNVLDWLLNK